MEVEMEENNSILETIKKMVGFDADYEIFDLDFIVLINTCFSTLHSLGVGPESGYFITSKENTWDEYQISSTYLPLLKSYIYMKTKLTFDRPETSYAIEALTKTASEIEWRLHMNSEESRNVTE